MTNEEVVTPETLKDVFDYDEEAEMLRAAERLKARLSQIEKEADAAARTKAERASIVRSPDVPEDSNTQELLREVCDNIRDFLLDKNAQYGDSAIHPVRIFSKASPIEQLYVRIDDKLSRIEKGDERIESDDDVIDDLIGYFILLKIARLKGLR
jgi:hypothetical protein